MNRVSDYITSDQELSIVEAMELIDKNTKGVLFIVDKKEKILGCLTDGDIRRGLIKTGDLNLRIKEIMNNAPKYLFEQDLNLAEEYMKKNYINALPIVNDELEVINVVFMNDIHKKISHKKDLKNVPIVIMAGGKGTRLYPFTKILPKPLIPIGDTPIIERIINQLCEYGAEDFYLTVNYKKGMIKSYFSDLEPIYNIFYVEEPKPLGTAGSIKLIDKKFTGPLIVTNCDSLIHLDYGKLVEYHQKSNNGLTMVTAFKNIIIPYGVIHSEEKGKISSLEEKPKLSYLINTGLYVLDPKYIDWIPKEEIFHMTDLANKLLNKGIRVGMYPISEDSFLDMGEFEEMKRMEEKLELSGDM